MIRQSGARKSTLLKILTREEKVSSGRISVLGEDLSKIKQKKIHNYRRNLGVIFQDFRILREKTVYENVEIPLLANNIRRKERKQKIESVLEELNISLYGNLFPDQLSGGQQQRVAIARALVSDSPIIMADEPTGALDKENAILLMEILKKINKKGNTIVVVTHSNLVASYADRIVKLNGGLIFEGGTRNEKKLE